MRPDLAARHAKLIEGLRELKRHKAAGGYAKSDPPGLEEASAAIALVIGFLRSDETAEERLIDPFYMLATAMVDISEGKRPEMLTVKRAVQGRQKGAAECNLMGVAALALDRLFAAQGGDLDGAATRVARAVHSAKLPGGARCTKETIKGWRARLMEGAGAKVPEMALMRWQAPLPPEAGSTPATQAAYLLERIKNSPALRWS